MRYKLNIITRLRTYLDLGFINLAGVILYRTLIKLGMHSVQRLSVHPALPPYFLPIDGEMTGFIPPAKTTNNLMLFSYWPLPATAFAPEWLSNPMNGQQVRNPQLAWWKIPDFDPAVGDIKLIWELSRLDWTLAFAQQARWGNSKSLARLNSWLADWCKHNPPYQGPNWKCGQEASIRVIHLACVAIMLGQVRKAPSGMRDLVALHLHRIAPTVHYAMAQDNNHGTSEAAALFMGGSWLELLGDARGADWTETGRQLLENRAARLIGKQGTFSQYSLNYHRLMIDTLSITECWRRHLRFSPFSESFYTRASAATIWLHTLIDPDTGDGPNVGANDGARLLQLTNSSYRDYRPSIQLAMVLFNGQRAYRSQGDWDHALTWLGIELPNKVCPPPNNLQADDGGFLVMRRGKAMVLLRYPRFHFRPSQADALHLDLWVQGKGCLRDAGTYSYNTHPKWLNYFGGVSGHNTIQFDSREQMPRLSRFLLGEWLRTEKLESLAVHSDSVQAGAGYIDRQGARHHRQVRLEDSLLRVHDHVSGFKKRAVIRWRLTPGDWTLDEINKQDTHSFRCKSKDNGHSLKITSNVQIVRCELIEGWESLHYLEKTSTPILELEIMEPSSIVTEYIWT
jgi:hypothetical protein